MDIFKWFDSGVEYDKEKLYEARWTFYHSLLVIQLVITNILLLVLIFK